MAFKSSKQRSGQAGSSNQSSTSRVRSAGMMGGTSRRRRKGPRGSRTSLLTELVMSAVLATSATVTMTVSNPGDGNVFWIADINPVKPTQKNIKAGVEAGETAADDAGAGPATDPFVDGLTGLTTATTYYFWAYQETVMGDGAIAGISFVTA